MLLNKTNKIKFIPIKEKYEIEETLTDNLVNKVMQTIDSCKTIQHLICSDKFTILTIKKIIKLNVPEIILKELIIILRQAIVEKALEFSIIDPEILWKININKLVDIDITIN